MVCCDNKDMTVVYLGLGSNLGDREDNLARAIQGLATLGVAVDAVSPLYQTAPWGGVEQPDFLNQVLRGKTALTPLQLAAGIKRLECELGRTKTCFWGPRVIDIDILLYGELTFEAKGLTIPHREICNRAFVLIPLLDVAPGLVLPGGLSAAAALGRLPADEVAGVVPYRA